MSLQSLGNHEFDDGIEGLLPFLKSTNTTFPMISSNIDDSKLPVDQKLTDYIKKSTTATINGKKIGIIGYVTTKTAVSIPICFQGRVVKLDRLVACKIRLITLIFDIEY